MEELAQEVINSLNTRTTDSEFVVNNSNLYISVPIDNKNYTLISSENSVGVYAEFSFIDGGQTIFFDSPSIAIGLIRIGVVNYDGTQRISRNKNEFYLLVKKFEDKFNVRTFPSSQFDNMDIELESIKNSVKLESGSMIGPQVIISLIRRCFELELAAQLKNPVLDGTLDAKSELERKYVSKLTNAIAISKTCTLTLNTGISLTKRLERKEGLWYYYPIYSKKNLKINSDKTSDNNYDTNFDSKIYFAKLHDKSRHVFRIDFSKDITNITNIENIFYALKNISNDPIFLGYPYGLIDVDQYVRVSDEEKDYLRIKFSAKLGKKFKDLSSEENSTNAHQILDSIRF